MKCRRCKSKNIRQEDDKQESICMDCCHTQKNHKTDFITVQVTSTFEIPITQSDKKHILWDEKDPTKL